MIKFIGEEVWAMDAEWVPDIPTGRRVYNLGPEIADADVLQHMFTAGGASDEEPRPYLKTVLCRVVSISALVRKRDAEGRLTHRLVTVPRHGEGPLSESILLQRFLDGVGKSKPQLVGFNIINADLPILLQRAAAGGVTAKAFCSRPDKPWLGCDYFVGHSDWLVDLQKVYGGWGKGTPSLHELACAAGIPGKIDTSGKDVLDLWQEGEISKIVAYNEFDALTTFLVWLRTVRLAGLIAADEADAEEADLRRYVADMIKGGQDYLTAYMDKWDVMSNTVTWPSASKRNSVPA